MMIGLYISVFTLKKNQEWGIHFLYKLQVIMDMVLAIIYLHLIKMYILSWFLP